MKMDEERLRNRDIRVRASDMEYALIQANFKASGMQYLNDFMISAAMDAFVLNVDYSHLKELCWEINKIGININQIAHKINSTDMVYQTDIDEIKDEMEKIVNMIRQQFYDIPGL